MPLVTGCIFEPSPTGSAHLITVVDPILYESVLKQQLCQQYMKHFTMGALKMLCKQQGLKVSGNKQAIVERLADGHHKRLPKILKPARNRLQ
jgi:hypothetical protein